MLAWSLVLALVTVAVYASVRGHAFLQFDDADYVTENAAVKAGLTWAGLRWALFSTYAGNWHPLTWASHMLDVQLFGLDAGWHHLTSLALHVLTTLILFRLFVRMTGALGASAFVAALFALHPTHVESVAWVAERKDVLSTFWWALALSAYVEYVRRGGWAWYSAVCLGFGLALLAKPMVITFPFLLLLLDVWPLGRWRMEDGPGVFGQGWKLVREKAVLFLMVAGSAAITYVAQQQAGAVQSLDALPFGLRLAKIPVAYVQYMASTFWPVRLAALYPYPSSIPLWQSLGALALLAAISVAAIRLMRAQPFVFVGWWWFIGTLVPVIGFVQVGSQPYADRFLYVPAIGLYVIVAWGARLSAQSTAGARRMVAVIGATVCFVMALMTARQVGYWKDSVALWERTVAVTTDNPRAQTNFGFALAEAGQRTRALAAYREAIRLEPAYPNAHNYLGVLLADLGDHDRAAAEYEEAIRLRPRFAEAHNNLGLTRIDQGRTDEAIAEFNETLRLDPSFTPARNNLAITYAQSGDFDKAIEEFSLVVQQQPESAESRLNLASALGDAGRGRDALPQFEAAAALGGDPVAVHHAWGKVLLDLGDVPGALGQFVQVVQANPRYAPGVRDLGRTLAGAGRLDEAISALQSAVQLQPGDPDYHHDLGAALARRGLIPQAIDEMRAALAIQPDHAEALEALRLLTKKTPTPQ